MDVPNPPEGERSSTAAELSATMLAASANAVNQAVPAAQTAVRFGP